MKFVDEVTIIIKAGNCGHGCACFRREKYIVFGGPDVGDGGKGGSVYFSGANNINTLEDFRHQSHFKAENGENGKGKNMTGKCGNDLNIPVPLGTEIYEFRKNKLLGEIINKDEKFLIANGGRRGLGNLKFKSSINRAPRKFTKGLLGSLKIDKTGTSFLIAAIGEISQFAIWPEKKIAGILLFFISSKFFFPHTSILLFFSGSNFDKWGYSPNTFPRFSHIPFIICNDCSSFFSGITYLILLYAFFEIPSFGPTIEANFPIKKEDKFNGKIFKKINKSESNILSMK